LFFLLSIFLLFKGEIIWAIFSGFFLAVSCLISIKTIFYIPTIIALFIIAIYTSKDRKQALKTFLIFAFCSICWVGILYLLHSHILTSTISKLPSSLIKGRALIANAGSKVLWTGKFLPRSAYISRSFIENSGTWFVVLSGIFISFVNLFSSRYRWRYNFILAFTLPLFSLLFYRNAFPYYFVFIMPLVLIISGVYVEISAHYKKQGYNNFAMILILVPVIIATVNSAKLIGYQLKDQIQPQRELISLVHRLFPEPVPYIDRSRMIASFPNVSFWMSTWGIEAYRQCGMPIMRSRLENNQPKFLIANIPILRINDDKWFGQNKSIYRLLDEDYTILKENFVHHWGILYVPGKRFKELNKIKMRVFEVLIEGKYTVESDGELIIDNRPIVSGEVVLLEKGKHTIETIKAHSALLRWGVHLYHPEEEPSGRPIFTEL
jgi:hypothetical protein